VCSTEQHDSTAQRVIFLECILQNVILNPLPPKLAKPAEVTRDEHFTTTTGTIHDQKHSGLVYGNQDPLYNKAPGHWKVDYNKDLHEKVCYNHCVSHITLYLQTSDSKYQPYCWLHNDSFSLTMFTWWLKTYLFNSDQQYLAPL